VQFITTVEACSGKVEVIVHEQIDHALYNDVVFKDLMPFFEKHVNDIEPDFDVIRAAARSWITWNGPK
jgi:hypothetical protein